MNKDTIVNDQNLTPNTEDKGNMSELACNDFNIAREFIENLDEAKSFIQKDLEKPLMATYYNNDSS